ncbi:MFS transporter [Peptacetobacter hominis]|uniref:MFS transporter n=1 Tax=Peptacetobacter hominis TaxID=2743610 RepID=A0A544QW97_9FIRM|nr:MFS transporter [Peptacetobacter hominis]TQQ84962.1 MFS transporter [Peptacetobacter hominis]
MKDKLTKLEKDWILYDVGNSAFILLTSTIMPIYFNYLADSAGISEVNYLAYWGYAASVSTIIVAIIGPVLGTMADTKNLKKILFTAAMMMGVIGCAALSVPTSWIVFLAVFVIAKVGYSTSLIFYDSMLTDVTTSERMDMVSSHGYAWGYIGSCIPFVISLVFVLMYEKIGISMNMAMTIAFVLNAAWWMIVTIPLLKNYKQTNYVENQEHIIKDSFVRIAETIKDIKNQKHIFMYLLSFFFFIDGVYTIIEMATAYGSALGLDSQGLLLALLLTQIVAFPCAIGFSVLSKKYKTDSLIKACIIAYTGIAVFAIQLDKQWEFWLLAVLVGVFQGAIQALSRSYFAKIIPPNKSGEYFGIYDICGKGASFIGTTLVGIVAQITGIANAGVGIIAVIFVIGFVLFCKSAKLNRDIINKKELHKNEDMKGMV